MSKVIIDERMRLYNEGWMDKDIAEAVGVGREAITIWRNRHNLPMNTHSFQCCMCGRMGKTSRYDCKTHTACMSALKKIRYEAKRKLQEALATGLEPNEIEFEIIVRKKP